MSEVAFPKVGSVVDGRYEIVKQLGVGGMGAVYQATFTSLGRTVALKILRPSLGENDSYQERFKREAEIAGKIQHPGIVQVTDFGRLDNGLLYMALDYVEGVELRKVVRSSKKGLPIARIQALFSQILEALSAAHNAGVVHRDLKPQNIMVQEVNGKELIKILDFGIARMESLQTMTQAGQIMGTAAYMAPEQSKGMKVDARADLYAVGVMLYEAVTGRMPFSGKTVTELIKKHRSAQAKDPCELRPDLPARYGELILKALAKEPDDRFQTAAEFLQELEDASQEAVLTTEDPTGARATGTRSKSTDTGTAATAATAILAGTGDVGTTASLYTHLVGQTIDDKYRIIEKLGEGGMGAVYKAEHVLLGRPVALKVMHPTHAQDPTFKERFLREVQVMMEFVHPNAIAVRDFGVSRDGLLFMTMDFSRGRPLKSLIKSERRLPERRALAIIRQTLMALSEGHKRGIVHRDIKPDNILVEEGDRVKVLDFGIAKIVDSKDGTEDKAGLTGSHVIGTPHYMSPEQASGEKVDARADLYAVGCVLYELLCGEKVFQGTTVMQALMAHVTQVPISVRERAPDANISRATNDLVNRALAKDPNKRFGSAAEFVQGITNIIGAGADLADPESTGGTLQVPANTGTVELDHAGRRPAPQGAGKLIGALVGAVVIAGALVFLNKDKLMGGSAKKDPDVRTASTVIPGDKTQKPPVEPPPTEQPPVEKPPAEKPPAEKPSAEQPPASDNPPVEKPPSEVEKPEAPPVEVKPTVAESGSGQKLSPLPPKDGPKTPPPTEMPPAKVDPAPPADQPPAEQPPAKVDPKPPVVEAPPTEAPPAEQPPAEQPPAEQPPAEQPPVEAPPAKVDPQPPVAETPPAKVEPQPPVQQPPVVEQPPAQPKVVEPPKPTRPSIAVLPFRFRNEVVQAHRGGYMWKIGVEESTNILTTDLTEKLVKLDRFDVVERERVAAALREQDFGQEGRMDPARAVAFGKMVGADTLILGDISELSFSQTFDDAGSFVRDRYTRKATLRMEVKLRVIDSRSTRVVAAETVSEEIVNIQRFLRAQIPMRVTLPMIRQLRLGVTRKVALAALDAVDPLKVIGVNDDGSVVVNRGEIGDFTRGQRLEVYKTGEGYVDPQTNRLYPGRRKLIGKLEVTDVQKTIAIARVVEGEVENGCFCKALAPPEKPAERGPFGGARKRRKKPGW